MARRRVAGWLAAGAGVLGLGSIGCGSEPPPMGFDGGPIVRSLSAQQVVAYEGMLRFVTVVDGDATTDLTGATIEPRDASSALVVREAVCSASACAVQLEIRDLTAPRAVPIPRPIDAVNDFLRIRLTDGEERQVLVTVWPVDTISNSGSPARIRGAIFASSASSEAGGTFQGTAGASPIRWLVMGDATLAGDLDVAGMGATGLSGGGDGGSAASAATGGGAAGGAGSGGGGGGGAEAGTDGSGTAGGVAGAAVDGACTTDFTADACGGTGGGGGAVGEGGAGGGTLMIAALGRITITGAVRAGGAVGADGEGAGGGGGGGQVVLAGTEVIVDAIDVAGGAGGTATGEGSGGAGGDGRIRIDTVSPPPTITDATGIAFDVAAADLIVDQASYVIRGRAPAGAEVRVEAIERAGVMGTATAGADGSFEVTVTLEPGLNRLRLLADGVRAWNGTSFESERMAGATMPQPTGGVLDVAYVPAGR